LGAFTAVPRRGEKEKIEIVGIGLVRGKKSVPKPSFLSPQREKGKKSERKAQASAPTFEERKRYGFLFFCQTFGPEKMNEKERRRAAKQVYLQARKRLGGFLVILRYPEITTIGKGGRYMGLIVWHSPRRGKKAGNLSSLWFAGLGRKEREKKGGKKGASEKDASPQKLSSRQGEGEKQGSKILPGSSLGAKRKNTPLRRVGERLYCPSPRIRHRMGRGRKGTENSAALDGNFFPVFAKWEKEEKRGGREVTLSIILKL